MRKPYYEVHITIFDDFSIGRDILKRTIEAQGWTFSAIEGDIILGKGVKIYATKHYNMRYSIATIRELLDIKAAALTCVIGAKVIRKKIEHVIHDEIVK